MKAICVHQFGDPSVLRYQEVPQPEVAASQVLVQFEAIGVMSRDATILGMILFNASEAEQASIHAALGAGLENGTLNPIVGQTFPLAEAAHAHEAVLHAGAYGKILLIP